MISSSWERPHRGDSRGGRSGASVRSARLGASGGLLCILRRCGPPPLLVPQLRPLRGLIEHLARLAQELLGVTRACREKTPMPCHPRRALPDAGLSVWAEVNSTLTPRRARPARSRVASSRPPISASTRSTPPGRRRCVAPALQSLPPCERLDDLEAAPRKRLRAAIPDRVLVLHQRTVSPRPGTVLLTGGLLSVRRARLPRTEGTPRTLDPGRRWRWAAMYSRRSLHDAVDGSPAADACRADLYPASGWSEERLVKYCVSIVCASIPAPCP